MSRLVPASLLLLVVLIPAGVSAAVSAYVVTNPAPLLTGDYSDGQTGDFILENDRIAVLISDVGHAGVYSSSGGNILDAGSSADRVDALQEVYTYFDNTWPRQAVYSSISIIDDGTGGGPALIRVQGVDSNDASLSVETDYSLADGADHVTIATTLTKAGGGAVQNFEVGDSFTWGSCTIYAPGYGFTLPDTTYVPWLAGVSDEISYGYASDTGGTIWGDHGGFWSEMNIETASISPGNPHTYTRYFAVGVSDVASVATILHEAVGSPIAQVSCAVSELAGGAPLPGAHVDVYDAVDAPYLQMVAEASGQAFATLPAGSWRLVASASGYTSEEVVLPLAASDSVGHNFVLEVDTSVPASGDTLTTIQLPLMNIPSLVTADDTLTIQCEADPKTTGWSAQLVRPGVSAPLSLVSSSYDPTTLWWTLRAPVPSGQLTELYDLVVTADGGIVDTTTHAVKILPTFKDDYYFIQITDPHLPTHAYYYEAGAENDTTEMMDLRAVIDDVSVIHPEFVLITGDLINEGELEDYLNYRYFTKAQRVLAEFDVPIFLQAGNHDLGGWDSTPPPDGTARRTWWRFFGWNRLDSPPPGAPAYTQDYSFDYGPVHYVGLESYNNYDGWRPGTYGTDSFTSGQLLWLSADLAAASASTSQVLFYHADFQSQLNLNSLGVEMALSGHIHSDGGSLVAQPYDLATNNVADGERAYRLVRVSAGVVQPTATMSAGSSGQNLQVGFSPANDGTNSTVTASVNNGQVQTFEHGQLRFVMPKAPAYLVTGGSLNQVDDSGAFAICYVDVDIQANAVQAVTVEVDATGTGVESISGLPSVLTLGRSLPNPFRSATTIRFGIPDAVRVRLTIHDVQGRLVATLANGEFPAGQHSVDWAGVDGRGNPSPSGVYFVRLAAGTDVRTRKIALAR